MTLRQLSNHDFWPRSTKIRDLSKKAQKTRAKLKMWKFIITVIFKSKRQRILGSPVNSFQLFIYSPSLLSPSIKNRQLNFLGHPPVIVEKVTDGMAFLQTDTLSTCQCQQRKARGFHSSGHTFRNSVRDKKENVFVRFLLFILSPFSLLRMYNECTSIIRHVDKYIFMHSTALSLIVHLGTHPAHVKYKQNSWNCSIDRSEKEIIENCPINQLIAIPELSS